jgi:hypothetical protein
MREAACHCGQLTLQVEGEPRRVSICHCFACQRRTGSAFGMQAGFDQGQVTISGDYKDYARISDEADQREHVFHFCPECGSQVFYTEPGEDFVVVAVGAFADPGFPPPTESGYDQRRHRWIELPEGIDRFGAGLWAEVHPLYEAGRYDEAADRAVVLLAEHPDFPDLAYNLACCESLAGRTADAIEHLGRAVDGFPAFRDMARGDTDFDSLRGEPAFQALIGD